MRYEISVMQKLALDMMEYIECMFITISYIKNYY